MRELRPFKHVRQRLWQRYRVRIRPAEYLALCQALGCGELLHTVVGGRVGDHEILIVFRYARRPILGVWSASDSVLITVLPYSLQRSSPHLAAGRVA